MAQSALGELLQKHEAKSKSVGLFTFGSWDLVTWVINRVTVLIITYNPH